MGKLLAAGLAIIPTAAWAADPEAGKAVFNKCMACHQVGSGAKNAAGPVLNGVVGRKASTAPGFCYSEPMKNSGLTWGEAALTAYLADPKAKVPGHKMVFAGLKDPADVANAISFLKTNN